MKLDHLDLDRLHLSALNVRKKGGKDIADLLPLVRRHGIIQPLLVRPNSDGFEIVAGQRRYNCLVALSEEGIAEPVPCIIMEDGDDAAAIEASLAENLGHLPMDEIDQYKAFSALLANGMQPDDIAAHFGVTERLVNQRLAIANLIEPILNAYRREDIGAETLRILTMATPRQQKAWWKLHKSEDGYAPTGRALREWLFGGSQVPVANALFDVAEYKGAIAADLFGEDSYFIDSDAFWALQGKAIAERREAYLEAGWAEVVVFDVGEHFATWQHSKTPKKQGGKVFVTCTRDGEVTFHEGWLSMKEARRREKAGTQTKDDDTIRAEKPELTNVMRNYLGLHKHAAVRTELLSQPAIALRLAVAHIIAGSGLWNVRGDEQRADNNTIRDSLTASQAEARFAEERVAIRALLGIDKEGDARIVSGGRWNIPRDLANIFGSLMHMEDATVLRILAFVMAETLAAHGGTAEALGVLLKTDMRNWWSPDETFFTLLRDKQAINAMVREIAGDITADAHTASTAKVQKKIIADCLDGTREAQAENWLPRYMAFPEEGYTARFTVGRMQPLPGAIGDDGDDGFDEAA